MANVFLNIVSMYHVQGREDAIGTPISTIHTISPARTRFDFFIGLGRESFSLAVGARDVVTSNIFQINAPKRKGRRPIYTGRAKEEI